MNTYILIMKPFFENRGYKKIALRDAPIDFYLCEIKANRHVHGLRYYIKGADYNKYMDIQQKVNLEIKRKFEEEGIKFAFPTQTVHLSQENELKEA